MVKNNLSSQPLVTTITNRTTTISTQYRSTIFKFPYNITTNQSHYNITKIQQMQCQENFNFSKFHLWIQQLHWPINTFYFYMSHLRLCFQHLHSILFTTWRWTRTRQRHSALCITTTLSTTATLTPQPRVINQFQSTHKQPQAISHFNSNRRALQFYVNHKL